MKREKLSKAAASGAVALIFLVLGFQAAIFTGNVFRYNREHRVDTVYVERRDSVNIRSPATNGQSGRSALYSILKRIFWIIVALIGLVVVLRVRRV